MVAQRMNVWSGLNVTVQTHPVASGIVVRDGLLGGSLDAGIMGAPGFVIGASTHDLVAVAVAEYAGNTLSLVVSKNITSAAQLKGKKVASQLGSGTDTIWTSEVAPGLGLPSGSYTPVNIKLANMTAALKTGQVDAFAGVDPFPEIASYYGYGKVLTTFAHYDPVPVYLVFTRSFVQAHPAAVQQFLTGWLKAVKEFKSNPAQTATMAASAFQTTGGGKVVSTIVKKAVGNLEVNPNFMPSTDAYLQKEAEYLKNHGKAGLTLPPSSQIIDMTPLHKAESAAGYSTTALPAGVPG